jgi:hypothetical protein
MVYRPHDLYESDSSYIWYIGRVTSMKVVQAPVILIIKRIIQLGQSMIKITLSYYLYTTILSLQNTLLFKPVLSLYLVCNHFFSKFFLIINLCT